MIDLGFIYSLSRNTSDSVRGICEQDTRASLEMMRPSKVLRTHRKSLFIIKYIICFRNVKETIADALQTLFFVNFLC
jgi:hypothetical protein